MNVLRRVFFGVILLLLASASPVHAAEPEPGSIFLRVYLQGDVTGRTELSIYKAYAGDAGPIFDVIPMPERDVDGYPQVEIETFGPIEAYRERGRIVIKSTGPGLGTVSVYVTDRSFRSSWQVHMAGSPGVGPVKANIVASFPPGTRALKEGNGVILQTATDSKRQELDRFGQTAWSLNMDLPSGTGIWVEAAYETTLAPLWLAQLGFAAGLAGLAVALCSLRFRRRTTQAERPAQSAR